MLHLRIKLIECSTAVLYELTGFAAYYPAVGVGPLGGERVIILSYEPTRLLRHHTHGIDDIGAFRFAFAGIQTRSLGPSRLCARLDKMK